MRFALVAAVGYATGPNVGPDYMQQLVARLYCLKPLPSGVRIFRPYCRLVRTHTNELERHCAARDIRTLTSIESGLSGRSVAGKRSKSLLMRLATDHYDFDIGVFMIRLEIAHEFAAHAANFLDWRINTAHWMRPNRRELKSGEAALLNFREHCISPFE